MLFLFMDIKVNKKGDLIMAYTLKAVTIRTNNSEEGIRKIGELWGDVLTGKLSLLADGVVPISQYSNYESDEKGDYDISIVGVEHNFFEDIEKEVEKGLYKKYEAVDENGKIRMIGHFKDGKKDGEFIEYEEDGSIIDKALYKNDEMVSQYN